MTTTDYTTNQLRRLRWVKYLKGKKKFRIEWPDVDCADFYSATEFDRHKNGFSGAQIFISIGGIWLPYLGEKMTREIKFFYVYRWIKQAALFDGMPDIRVKEELGIGHIAMDAVLLCGANPEQIQKESCADGHITVATSRKGVPLCSQCQEAWKRLPRGQWKAWEEMEAKKV